MQGELLDRSRRLTDFEHVLIGLVAGGARSGYELKRYFASTPAKVYEPSSGALYPALLRLEKNGLLAGRQEASAGRRRRKIYRATPAGIELHHQWLRSPVEAETVGRDLGIHLMRFALAEPVLTRAEVMEFLVQLRDGLRQFNDSMRQFLDQAQLPGRHPALAIQHGIAVHQASLDWVEATIAQLSEPDPHWAATNSDRA